MNGKANKGREQAVHQLKEKQHHQDLQEYHAEVLRHRAWEECNRDGAICNGRDAPHLHAIQVTLEYLRQIRLETRSNENVGGLLLSTMHK